MLQRFRESLSLILIALMPLHAMLVTVTTSAVLGYGHAPLALIALWKEAILGVLLLVAVIEILSTEPALRQRSVWRPDYLDLCIVLAIVMGVAVSFRGIADTKFLLGFKYDFLPLVSFLILRRVAWSRQFFVAAARTLVLVGGVASLYGIATLFLPLSFFTALGYSEMHSLYLPDSAIASFQFLEGTNIRRMQSFMSGPNQFGLWLLLPLAAGIPLLIKSVREHRRLDAALYVAAGLLVLAALFLTYSRSAWIGGFIILVVVAVLVLWPVVRSTLHRSTIFMSAGVIALALVLLGAYVSPEVLLRSESLRGHIEKPLTAIQMIRAHPFGLGLGSAGPASNRLSDTCVFLDAGADYAWAEPHTELCVFLGGEQKLPVGKKCQCPLLTENWYLQWGVEMGIVGLLLSLAIVVIILGYGRRVRIDDMHIFPLLAFLGIAVGGLFLHAFEDAAVAYTVWILLSACGIVFLREAR